VSGFTRGIHCLFTLAAVLKEKAPGDNQSLEHRWLKFHRLPFTVHANQVVMLPDKHMRTRNLPGGKGRPAREADLTAICKPIV
jgi:hypothetical protein